MPQAHSSFATVGLYLDVMLACQDMLLKHNRSAEAELVSCRLSAWRMLLLLRSMSESITVTAFPRAQRQNGYTFRMKSVQFAMKNVSSLWQLALSVSLA